VIKIKGGLKTFARGGGFAGYQKRVSQLNQVFGFAGDAWIPDAKLMELALLRKPLARPLHAPLGNNAG